MQLFVTYRMTCVVGLLSAWLTAAALQAAESIALHVETLTVPPSTQPLLFVAVQNLQDKAYNGSIAVKGPEGWRLAPASRPIALAPAETKRVPFTIEQGRNVEANTYAFEVTATGEGGPVMRRQETFVASAPYHPVTIDGKTEEWSDAIPVTFTTKGQKTVISTYWNRRKFAILVAVQEKQLVPYPGPGGAGPFDAVQFALAPLEASGDTPHPQQAGRFEFLLVAAGDAARCFGLAATDTPWSDIERPRTLEPLALPDAEVAVRRVGDVTYYECALPFRLLRDEIRPSEGAEFFLSVLIHDPDGTGLRDLAQAAGLGPSARDRQAWSRWPGAKWGDAPPLNHPIRWGLCTSKY
jgi:NPCBM-associated, NEW3 domain of alpha-galactosidase